MTIILLLFPAVSVSVLISHLPSRTPQNNAEKISLFLSNLENAKGTHVTVISDKSERLFASTLLMMMAKNESFTIDHQDMETLPLQGTVYYISGVSKDMPASKEKEG